MHILPNFMKKKLKEILNHCFEKNMRVLYVEYVSVHVCVGGASSGTAFKKEREKWAHSISMSCSFIYLFILLLSPSLFLLYFYPTPSRLQRQQLSCLDSSVQTKSRKKISSNIENQLLPPTFELNVHEKAVAWHSPMYFQSKTLCKVEVPFFFASTPRRIFCCFFLQQLI